MIIYSCQTFFMSNLRIETLRIQINMVKCVTFTDHKVFLIPWISYESNEYPNRYPMNLKFLIKWPKASGTSRLRFGKKYHH